MNRSGYLAKQRAIAAGHKSMQAWVVALIKAGGLGTEEMATLTGISNSAVLTHARKAGTLTPIAQKRRDNAAAALDAGYSNTSAWVWGLHREGKGKTEITKITSLSWKTVSQYLDVPEKDHVSPMLAVLEREKAEAEAAPPPPVETAEDDEPEEEDDGWVRPIIEKDTTPLHLLPRGPHYVLITPGELTCKRCGDTVGPLWVAQGGKCMTCVSDKYLVPTESYLHPDEMRTTGSSYTEQYIAIQMGRSLNVYQDDPKRETRTFHGIKSKGAKPVDGWKRNGVLVQIFQDQKNQLWEAETGLDVPATQLECIPVVRL